MQTLRNPDSEPGKVVPSGDQSPEPVETDAPAALVVPRYGAAWRALFGFVALAMAFMAAVLVVEGGGWMAFVLAAGAALVGGTTGYFAVTGRRPSLYTPSPRFAELADPTRPLTSTDPISISPEKASTDAPAVSEDGN